MLSREQDNVQYYLSSGSLLYEAFPSLEEGPLREGLFALDSAVASFGRAEMAVYKAERNQAARQPYNDDDIETALATFQRAGLEYLDMASGAISDFRLNVESLVERGGKYDTELLERRASAFDVGVRRELANLEIKPKDIERIIEQLDEALVVAKSGDPLALVDHIAAKLKELAGVRAGNDRGMVDNIPWWKIVAVAVFFAITIWALFRCVWRWFGPRCSPSEGLIYVLIAKAAALGFKLC